MLLSPSIMYLYLTLALLFLSADCDENEERAKVVNEILNVPALWAPPDSSISKVFAEVAQLPQSIYDGATDILDKMLPQLKLFSAENLIRKNFEDTKEIQLFFENTSQRSMTRVLKAIGSVGQVSKSLFKVWRITRGSSSQEKLVNPLMKSLQELDSNVVEQLKSYVDNTLEALKETDLKPDHFFVKGIAQVKVMFEIFEVTGGNEPSEELSKANPWLDRASSAILPIICQNIALGTEFAHLVRTIS